MFYNIAVSLELITIFAIFVNFEKDNGMKISQVHLTNPYR